MSNPLQKLLDRAQELQAQQTVSLDKILTDDFVSEHTKFSTANELFEGSGFKLESVEDFYAIPDDEWDAYIAKVSTFENWLEMQKAAALEYMKSQLDL